MAAAFKLLPPREQEALRILGYGLTFHNKLRPFFLIGTVLLGSATVGYWAFDQGASGPTGLCLTFLFSLSNGFLATDKTFFNILLFGLKAYNSSHF